MLENEVMIRSVAIRRASLRTTVSAVLACVAGSISVGASAVPVIPQGAGYGLETPAGRGGAVHRVTNLNASGPGSLKACIDASGPRVCVFEVSGTIRVTNDFIIRNPNITIAGQTAPSPGVMVRGGALWVATSEVLIQHMRVRAGDDAIGPEPSNRDALKIGFRDNPARNVVIDHCSFSWALDEVVSVWQGFDNVTLSNNIVSEGLRAPELGTTAGYGLLVGPWNGRVAIIGNLLAHNKERNPLSRTAQAVIVNNVVYNGEHMDVDLQSEGGIATNTSVIGNVFIRGADYSRGHKPVLIRTDGTLALPATSKVYLADNAAIETSANDEWSVVQTSGGAVPSTIKSATPPTWPPGLTRLPTDANVTLNSVLRLSGARPADRDPVDRRVVQSVRDRTGRVINCVSPSSAATCSMNAGGWPQLAENRRTLTLPANHNEVTPSGYTRLELWLHQMAAQVEGRSYKQPSPPALSKQ
jgi:pectate lyase